MAKGKTCGSGEGAAHTEDCSHRRTYVVTSDETLLHIPGGELNPGQLLLRLLDAGKEQGQVPVWTAQHLVSTLNCSSSQAASCSFLHQGSWGRNNHKLWTGLGLTLPNTDLILMSVEHFRNAKLYVSSMYQIRQYCWSQEIETWTLKLGAEARVLPNTLRTMMLTAALHGYQGMLGKPVRDQ